MLLFWFSNFPLPFLFLFSHFLTIHCTGPFPVKIWRAVWKFSGNLGGRWSIAPVWLLVRPSIYLLACLFVGPSVCLCFRPHACLSIYLSICLTVCLSLYLIACVLFVCLVGCISICQPIHLPECLNEGLLSCFLNFYNFWQVAHPVVHFRSERVKIKLYKAAVRKFRRTLRALGRNKVRNKSLYLPLFRQICKYLTPQSIIAEMNSYYIDSKLASNSEYLLLKRNKLKMKKELTRNYKIFRVSED